MWNPTVIQFTHFVTVQVCMHVMTDRAIQNIVCGSYKI
jgi:hypothetical protein